MKTDLRVTDPKSVEFTLSVTMTLESWRELQAQLKDQWPSWKLSQAINDMAAQATSKFYPKEREE